MESLHIVRNGLIVFWPLSGILFLGIGIMLSLFSSLAAPTGQRRWRELFSVCSILGMGLIVCCEGMGRPHGMMIASLLICTGGYVGLGVLLAYAAIREGGTERWHRWPLVLGSLLFALFLLYLGFSEA